jgi:5'-deoxynucleotidase YfbR-like HD superfamily hydrolase
MNQIPRDWSVQDTHKDFTIQYGNHPYAIGSREIKGADLYDIANSLARTGRFVGHIKIHLPNIYSVARHSVFVSELLDHDSWLAMYGLTHDLHESVTNDLASPVKAWLGPEFRARLAIAEEAADEALHKVLNVPWPMPAEYKALVKRADMIAAITEKRDLLYECDVVWDDYPVGPSHKTVQCGTIEEDAKLFEARYELLAKHLGIWKD